MKLAGPSVRARAGDAGPAEGHSLAFGDRVPSGLLDVGEGGELVVKSTVSGRELAVRGPAVAELCPAGDEEVRLSAGTFRGFPGAGVRPGAEVWVATPFGVVRFNDANLEVSVSPRAASLSVKVVSGQAVFVPALTDREVTVPAGTPFSADGPRPSPKELAGACAGLAAAVEEKAVEVLSSDAGSLGRRAGLYVEARNHARVVCSSAAAAAGLADRDRDALLRQIESAEKQWKSVPMTRRTADASSGAPRSN